MSVAMESGNREVGLLLYTHEERHKSASVRTREYSGAYTSGYGGLAPNCCMIVPNYSVRRGHPEGLVYFKERNGRTERLRLVPDFTRI